MRDILLISRAWRFAAQRHSTQRRKGKAQEPYVNHLAEVVELVATATEGKDTNLVAAPVLHDTIEDTANRALFKTAHYPGAAALAVLGAKIWTNARSQLDAAARRSLFAPMRGENPQRQPLPIARHAERTLPDARRPVPGRY
jgi:hypothetical protein